MTERLRGRRALILGGLGFIGSNLALRLVEAGADVTIVDALISEHGGDFANIDPIRDRVRVNISDVRDAQSLPFLVADQEWIFSLAAQVGHLASMTDPSTDLDINCRGQLSLLECCRRVNPGAKIVFASTRQVYGRPLFLPLDERHPVAPVDVNGVSKRAAELLHKVYHQAYRLRTTSLRMTNTYGPRLNLRGASAGLVGAFLRIALQQGCLEIFGTGAQRRDFNYVDDVVDALILAALCPQTDGQIFNLGHPRHYSLLEVAEIIRRHTGANYRCVPFPTERAAIDPGDCYCDFSRFREATGWSPQVDLPEGIARTVDFFRQSPSQKSGAVA